MILKEFMTIVLSQVHFLIEQGHFSKIKNY